MRSALRLLALTAVFSPLAGCALERAVVRNASDLPARFMVVENGTTREARPGEGCHSPLQDPRDGTRLTLGRSANGTGDYSAPAGRYGTSARTYLRIDCATGEAVGVVVR